MGVNMKMIQQMQNRISRRAFPRVDYAPRAQFSGVARLAAAERIEHRAVELDHVVLNRNDGGLARGEVRIIAKEELSQRTRPGRR